MTQMTKTAILEDTAIQELKASLRGEAIRPCDEAPTGSASRQ